MPVPTADELVDDAATLAAEGVASATVDGRSATSMDPLKQIQVAEKIAARQVTNAWGSCLRSRASLPGSAE